MKISEQGLDLIKEREGYLTAQADGSCRSYRCPAGKWTCGWGCTEGVGPNTHWTREEATAALAREMGVHERHVLRLVKVPLDQGQFDALVSLCYNIGAGNLGRSTLLAHLNRGDYARAASHFADWKRARVYGAVARQMKVRNGTSVVLPGLVTRRAKEAALFLAGGTAAPMPQRIEPETTKLRVGEAIAKVGLATGAGGAGIGTVALPAAPDLSSLVAWKGAIAEGQQIAAWGMANWPLVAGAGAVYLAVSWLLPRLLAKREEAAA